MSAFLPVPRLTMRQRTLTSLIGAKHTITTALPYTGDPHGTPEPHVWGIGFYLRSDNDLIGTGGNRTNAFSEHVHASVQLAIGGSGTVNAGLEGTGRDGAPVFVTTFVILNTGGN